MKNVHTYAASKKHERGAAKNSSSFFDTVYAGGRSGMSPKSS
ncbi:hypothetical protein CLOBOL_06198 [Enterocloster bolteae ATCC BAA-613]|uniref:Uncharacterized protein n=1 Tax=Enterocloster bolteae (strain ATCC BAA-613 / DSM 15670 / CCUG 46953 / JCM 12243 / WAL 16351) TaxID=411902 RepID=A8S1X3_ENTBW|nr:hypothetical protein CLOBOL_06198 [Enterocloster bolteae ATCC BAA-613]